MSRAEWSDEEARILEQRTRALARPVAAARRETGADLVLRVSGERYAIAAAEVLSASALTRLTPLPHSPPELAGLTSRAGRVLPVFDLRAVLGLPLATLPEHGRMVILGTVDAPVAVTVDAIDAVETSTAEALAEPPPTTSAALRRVLLGVDADGILHLDVPALLERLVVDIPPPQVRST